MINENYSPHLPFSLSPLLLFSSSSFLPFFFSPLLESGCLKTRSNLRRTFSETSTSAPTWRLIYTNRRPPVSYPLFPNSFQTRAEPSPPNRSCPVFSRIPPNRTARDRCADVSPARRGKLFRLPQTVRPSKARDRAIRAPECPSRAARCS